MSPSLLHSKCFFLIFLYPSLRLMPFIEASVFLHCNGTFISVFTITRGTLRTERSENGIPVGAKFFVPCRPASRPDQPVVQCLLCVPGAKAAGGVNKPLPSFSAEVSKAFELCLHPTPLWARIYMSWGSP